VLNKYTVLGKTLIYTISVLKYLLVLWASICEFQLAWPEIHGPVFMSTVLCYGLSLLSVCSPCKTFWSSWQILLKF